MQDNYKKTLAWAKKKGLFLDKRIERKQENGVYGMYAKEAIPSGTVFISFPIEKLVPGDSIGQGNMPPPIKLMAASAIEIPKGEDSDYFGCFAMFDDYKWLKENSVFFFDEADFKYLEKMSPILTSLARSAQAEIREFTKMVKGIVPESEDDVVNNVVLNYVSRGWGNLGFVPIIDLFNHSDRKGAKLKQIKDENGKLRIGLISRIDYQKGDQIYDSYARKDLVSVATKYNYFDPEGPHFIDYASRVMTPIPAGFKEKLFGLLAQKYKAQVGEFNGQRHFKLVEPGMFFTERAPSPRLIDYFRDSSIDNEDELKVGRPSDQKMLSNMLNTLNALIQANQIDNFKLEDVPEKLHRFYHLLKKEKAMLIENQQWVLDNLEF